MIHLLCEELIQYISERFDSGYEALIWQFNLRCTCIAMRYNTIVFPEIVLNPYRFKFTPAIFGANTDITTGFDLDVQQWKQFDMKMFTNYIKRGSVHVYFSFWLNKYMWFKNRKFYLSNDLNMFTLNTKKAPKAVNKTLLTYGMSLSKVNTTSMLRTCLKTYHSIYLSCLCRMYLLKNFVLYWRSSSIYANYKLNLSNNNFTKTMYAQIYKAGLKLEHLNLSYTYFGCGWFDTYHLAVWYDFILKCKLQVLKTDIPGFSTPKNEKNEGWTLYYDSFMQCVNNSSIKSLHIYSNTYGSSLEWYEYVGMVAKQYQFDNLEKVTLNGETISFPQHCVLCQHLELQSLQSVQEFIDLHTQRFVLRIPKQHLPMDEQKIDNEKAPKAAMTKRERYDQRNAYRNQYLKEDRKCKACAFCWPKGSIKIQTFEGIQSKCNRGIKLCSETSHAAGFWEPLSE